MAGDEDHAMRVFTVGQRHIEAAHRGESRSDAIDHSDFNARCLQSLDLFTAPPEYKGVSAFEAHHLLAVQGLADHEFVDKSLRRGCTAAPLADIDNARVGPSMAQHSFVHQIVYQQDGCAGNGFDGFECEQFRVTRACADEGDFADRVLGR